MGLNSTFYFATVPMEEMLASRTAETGRVTYVGTPETMSSVIAAYEMSAFITQGILN